MVASNEVTKKEVASIDLKKMIGLTDLNAIDSTGPADGPGSPQSRKTAMTLRPRESDEGYLTVRARSFRVEFEGGEGIVFSTDRDEEKVTW